MPHEDRKQRAEKTWLDHRSREYRDNERKWRYVEDHYSGSVLEKLGHYLVQRPVGETKESFQERKKLADYTPHYSAVVDALAGMLFSVEDDANRSFVDEDGNGIGRPEDRETVAWRLWNDADGKGNNWLTKWKQLAIELINQKVVWVLQDTNASGDPQVKIVSPLDVVNVRWADSRPVEVLMRERVDTRDSIKDAPAWKDQFILFELDGFTRWEVVEAERDGETVRMAREISDGKTSYSYQGPKGRPELPIFRVELPMRRHVGYLLARKANAIFNKESERDHLLRTANFPVLTIVGDDDFVSNQMKKLRQGARVLQKLPGESGSHEFMAPSSEPATVASKVLERKVEEFYVTAFREYGDAAREKTATEVKQDISAGVGAFLQMLKAAVDDAENGMLWRIEQQQFPDDPSQHFVARVERADDFSPLNIHEVVKRLKERYFGTTDPMPVGKTGLMDAAKQVAEFDGVEFDEDELEDAIESHETTRKLDTVLQLDVPAVARAHLVVNLIESVTGMDLDDTITMEDDSEEPLRDVLFSQALALAESRDETQRRQAEAGAGFGGMGGGSFAQ